MAVSIKKVGSCSRRSADENLKIDLGTISAPPFGKGRWLRLSEDEGIDVVGIKY